MSFFLLFYILFPDLFDLKAYVKVFYFVYFHFLSEIAGLSVFVSTWLPLLADF